MSSTPGISLRGLRTFCVSAEHESFREAGEQLFITASAVSHQIKSVEDELGKQLFDRNSRSIELIATGRALYEEVSPLMTQLAGIVASYKTGGKRGAVRISVQPFFASELFVARLGDFTARHPDIDIQVGTSDESSEKHPPTEDLSIPLFRSPPTDLPSDLLFPLRLVPAGAPELRESLRVRKKAIVTEFPLIIHETLPKAWEQWSEASGIALPEDAKMIRMDSMVAAARAAERGVGAAIVSTATPCRRPFLCGTAKLKTLSSHDNSGSSHSFGHGRNRPSSNRASRRRIPAAARR